MISSFQNYISLDLGFRNLLGRIFTSGWIWLQLLFCICGCSNQIPEVFYRNGDLEELKMKAIRACFGNFRVLEETTFGPFIRARLECVDRYRS